MFFASLRAVHRLVVRRAVLELRAPEGEAYELARVVVLDVVADGVAATYFEAAPVRVPVNVVRPAVGDDGAGVLSYHEDVALAQRPCVPEQDRGLYEAVLVLRQGEVEGRVLVAALRLAFRLADESRGLLKAAYELRFRRRGGGRGADGAAAGGALGVNKGEGSGVASGEGPKSPQADSSMADNSTAAKARDRVLRVDMFFLLLFAVWAYFTMENAWDSMYWALF